MNIRNDDLRAQIAVWRAIAIVAACLMAGMVGGMMLMGGPAKREIRLALELPAKAQDQVNDTDWETAERFDRRQRARMAGLDR